jgi:hypothetical protein
MPPISLNVNIDKIDKTKFFEGKKGRYLDLVLWETPESDYGDFMVKQQGEKGEKMPILGNGKHFKLKAKKQPDGEAQPAGERKDPW